MQINALIHRFAASHYLEIIYTITEAYVQGILSIFCHEARYLSEPVPDEQ